MLQLFVLLLLFIVYHLVCCCLLLINRCLFKGNCLYRRCHFKKFFYEPEFVIEVFSRSLGRIYIARETNNAYVINNALYSCSLCPGKYGK